jgi:hypothetical protein
MSPRLLASLSPESSARQASARRSFKRLGECVSSQPCGLAQHTRRQDPRHTCEARPQRRAIKPPNAAQLLRIAHTLAVHSPTTPPPPV